MKVSLETECKRKKACGHEVLQNDLKYEGGKKHEKPHQ